MFDVKMFKSGSAVKRFTAHHLQNNPQRIILLSFSCIIAVGTLLLSLPIATTSAGSLNFVDTFFTATSATCVTGLVVVDVAETFTLFGEIVILLMIQLGGLGLMSFSTFFMFLLIGKFSISGREVLVDTFSQSPVSELGRLLVVVFAFTVILEAIGALLLTSIFMAEYPMSQAIYYGVFHAISAFCNAGFSLLPEGYLPYTTNWYFNTVNILLIMAGGFGFIVIYDVITQLKYIGRGFFRRITLHSKVVLTVTAILLLSGILVFLFLEYNQSLKSYSWYDKLLISTFQSVTTRTAGFNTVDISQLSAPTLFFMVLLMFIGASPGSCGGGIKTTTFALFIQSITRNFTKQSDVNIFFRRVPEEVLTRATSIVFFSVFTIGGFTFLLLISEIYMTSRSESDLTLMNLMFEVVSAFGTVGLSTGVTDVLTPFGKVLITILMYVGRLGPLTLIFGLQLAARTDIRYMKEDIMVG